MTVQEFAEQYRVRVRRDTCGEEIISGKRFCKDMPDRLEYRSHFYDHVNGRFGLCLLFATAAKWTYAKRRLSTLMHFALKQEGDREGTLLFDPSDPKQARTAIREAKVKYRRVLTEADRIARADRLKRVRTAEDGQLLAGNRSLA
jgi:hypothetical protein